MYKTVKGFFEYVRHTRQRVNDLKEEISMLEADTSFLQSSGIGGLGVQNNSRKDLSDCLIRLEARKEKALRLISENEALQEEGKRLIQVLDYTPWESVLFHRYILGEPWKDIMEKVGYGETAIFVANRKAQRKIGQSKEWQELQERMERERAPDGKGPDHHHQQAGRGIHARIEGKRG